MKKKIGLRILGTLLWILAWIPITLLPREDQKKAIEDQSRFAEGLWTFK